MWSHDENMQKPPITVMGIGNLLYSDEGMGVHILPALREAFSGQADVEVIEGATDGMLLLAPVESTNFLLVIDAIQADKPPGEIICLEDEDIPKYMSLKMSIHQGGFQEVLALAKFRGRLPQYMFLCGIQPESLKLGMELTDVVKEQLPSLIQVVQDKVNEWRALL